MVRCVTQLVTRVLGVCATLALIGAASAQINVQLAPAIALQPTSTSGNYLSAPISVSVSSTERYWKLYITADPVPTSAGPVAASKLQMLPQPGTPPPGTNFAVKNRAMSNLNLLAWGDNPGPVTVGSFVLQGQFNPELPAGALSGTLRVFAQLNWGSALQQVAVVPFTVTIDGFVRVNFTFPTLSYTVPQPGETYSNTAFPFEVVTNMPSANVSLSLGALVNPAPGGGTFPASRICIAQGTSRSNANWYAKKTPLGTTTINFTVPYGRTKLYAGTRMQTTASDKPGTYSGTLSLTAGGS